MPPGRHQDATKTLLGCDQDATRMPQGRHQRTPRQPGHHQHATRTPPASHQAPSGRHQDGFTHHSADGGVLPATSLQVLEHMLVLIAPASVEKKYPTFVHFLTSSTWSTTRSPAPLSLAACVQSVQVRLRGCARCPHTFTVMSFALSLRSARKKIFIPHMAGCPTVEAQAARSRHDGSMKVKKGRSFFCRPTDVEVPQVSCSAGPALPCVEVCAHNSKAFENGSRKSAAERGQQHMDGRARASMCCWTFEEAQRSTSTDRDRSQLIPPTSLVELPAPLSWQCANF